MTFNLRKFPALSLSVSFSLGGIVFVVQIIFSGSQSDARQAEAISANVDIQPQESTSKQLSARVEAGMEDMQSIYQADSLLHNQQNKTLHDDVAELLDTVHALRRDVVDLKGKLSGLEGEVVDLRVSRGRILLGMFVNNITDILGVHTIGDIDPLDRSGRTLSDLLRTRRTHLEAFIDERNLDLSLDDLDQFRREIDNQRIPDNRDAHAIIFSSESDVRILERFVQDLPYSKTLYDMRGIRDELVAYENCQGSYAGVRK